jgi:ribonuclease-3
VFVIEDIQGTLGYVFHHKPLLYEALTHRSFLQAEPHPTTPHNERLEFLGDAVLGLIVSESLVGMFPHSTEGELSKLKAGLISRATLAKAAGRVHLGQWLRLGRGEEVSLGRAKHSLLANALEALIGAVYLDSGVESARTLIHRLLDPEFLALRDSPELPAGGDWKSRLQEWMHKHDGTSPRYRLIQESGPDHQKVFSVNVENRGKVIGQGQGRTKKEAEQRAAEQALEEVCRQGSGTTRN